MFNAFHFCCLRSILAVSWRDLIANSIILGRTGALEIFPLYWNWIDSVWVVTCAEWKMVVFRRTFSMGNYPLLIDLSVAPTADRRTYKQRIWRHFNLNTKHWEQLAVGRALWRSLLQDRREYSIQTYITDCNRHRSDRRKWRERS